MSIKTVQLVTSGSSFVLASVKVKTKDDRIPMQEVASALKIKIGKFCAVVASACATSQHTSIV